MRNTRIYQPGTYGLDEHVILDNNASNHVSRVLRMQPGAALTLFCGDNREFQTTILAIKKHQVTVCIHSIHHVNRESPCVIHLAQGIAKGERMRFIIQKAVELGVASITPLLTQHGAVKHNKEQLAKKHAQWESIAIAACEQSGRNTVPPIHAPCMLTPYLDTCLAKTRWLLAPSETHALSTRSEQNDGEVALLIGAEGGFNADEIKAAKNANFQGLCLGPRVLRTETATLVALSVLQAQRGDL
jgi:16S rRNA (uracil1498-N3)-methyltransferase